MSADDEPRRHPRLIPVGVTRPLLETEHSLKLLQKIGLILDGCAEPVADALVLAENRGRDAALDAISELTGAYRDPMHMIHIADSAINQHDLFRSIERKLGRQA